MVHYAKKMKSEGCGDGILVYKAHMQGCDDNTAPPYIHPYKTVAVVYIKFSKLYLCVLV